MTLFQSFTGARFPCLCLSVIKICCLAILATSSPTSTADDIEELSVTDTGGEYSLRITVVLNAPVEYVYKVITDYTHVYRINPTITNVEILPSGYRGVVRVQNLTKQCVGPFCFDIVWTGDIVETGDRDLEITTIPELSDFVSGSANWHIRPQGALTRVIYESRLRPSFFIPPVIGGIIIRKHIKDDTLDTFRRIESQAKIMLDLDKRQQVDDLKMLSKEGSELFLQNVAVESRVSD